MVALLQGILTGTARQVYNPLSAEDSPYYDVVKDCILRAYEHIPKFYRQQFRSYKNKLNYIEKFAREKEQFFDSCVILNK